MDNGNSKNERTQQSAVCRADKEAESVAKSRKYTNLDLKWKEEYNTGVAEIDLQHRNFLKLIEKINCSIINNEPINYIKRLISELIYYTKFHFCSEENLMIYSSYPELDKQQNLHMELIELLNDKINSIFDNSIEHHELVTFLLKWFVRHTMEEDRKIGLFLKS